MPCKQTGGGAPGGGLGVGWCEQGQLLCIAGGLSRDRCRGGGGVQGAVEHTADQLSLSNASKMRCCRSISRAGFTCLAHPLTASRINLLAQCALALTFHTTRITLSSITSHNRPTSHIQCSREKVQLTDQLQRAEEEIEKARTAIRDLIKICEDTSGQRTIPPDAIDEEGEVDAWAIVCSVCDDYESYDVSGGALPSVGLAWEQSGQGWVSKPFGMLGVKTADSAFARA